MVPSVVGDRTVYVEYMVINGKWETIGDSDVQLVNYYTKHDIDDKFTSYVPYAEDGISVDLAGSLTVTDSATFSGFTEVQNDFAVEGYIEVGGSANVIGAAYLQSTLDVAGIATFAANISAADAFVKREGSFVQVATIDDIEAAFNDFGDSGLKAYIDAQDDAHQAAAEATASAYTDAQIASALTGLPEGSKLVAYIDAQDDLHLGSANAYTDSALANYFDKDIITASYVPFAEDGSSVILTGDITAVNANLQGANIDGDAGVGGLLTATTVSVVTDADVAGNLTVAGAASVNTLAVPDALFVSSNVSVVVPLDVDFKATFGADI